MHLGNGLGHLTYSTLVHPGDTWDQMWTSLRTFVPKVKQQLSPDDPFGVCLRLSARSADTLVRDPAAVATLQHFLADHGMYLYTANAFPYGSFKGTIVKEEVYEPDWRSNERTVYTKNVADVLAAVAVDGVAPSIQSPPLGFKPRVTGPDVVASFTDHVLEVTAHLVDIERRTGKTVTLALEPEPYCFLETTQEVVAYFRDHLYTGPAAVRLAALTGLPVSESHAALRRHVGIVFDICHQAIEYEDVTTSLQRLVDAGIPIFKLQQAAAIHVPQVTEEAVHALTKYAQTIYLTQTIEKRDGQLTRYLNLEEAFADWNRNPGPGREWRVHIHVPVFLDDLGPFRTTRFAIEDALAFHRRTPLSSHLEVETYTWDVLPDSLKTGDIVEYVCRELEWVKGQLLPAAQLATL
jgi:sugar phosphate isomerase/epimerase